MNANGPTRSLITLASAFLFFGMTVLAEGQQDSILQLRQKAITEAVNHVSPALVRLDLFSESHPELRVATATLISNEGEMITSSFFVPNRETIISAQWNNEKRAVRVVAQDFSRGLTLLKMDVDQPTPFINLLTPNVFVGQTAIAHGKTLSSASTNISVGIISALKRAWGKAIQTDAKISPANYGGPLTDLAGNTLGILTSLSPDGTGKADAEWYDSGIGFAIPSADVLRSIKKMKTSGDLYSGKLGIQFQDKNPLTGKLVVAQCFPRSPAAESGVQPNDLITKIGEQPIKTFGQFRQLTDSIYGGDKISLTIHRGKSLKKIELTATNQLSVYKAPYMGIFPDYGFRESGVRIQSIDPAGPANGKIPSGATITKVNDEAVRDIAELRTKLAQFEAGQMVHVGFQNDNSPTSVALTLDDLTRELNSNSIPSNDSKILFDLKSEEIKVSGFENKCRVWFPAESPPLGTAKCLVLLAKTSTDKATGEIPVLKELLKTEGHVIVLLSPASLKGWQSDEKEFINLALRKVNAKYTYTRTNCLLTREKACKFGMDLFREQSSDFGGFLLKNPMINQDTILPLARPGTSVFTFLQVDKPLVIHGVKLQRRILENGIPAKMIVRDPSTDDKRSAEIIRSWLRSIDRI